MKCFNCGWELLELSQRNNRCFRCGVDLDPNYCGLEPLTTGDWDPFYQSGACPTHDNNQTARKAALSTAARFAYDSMNTAVINTAKAVYSVAFVIPYIAIGGIGGYFRDIFRKK